MLENPKINIKLKLAALWTTLMFLYIYGDYFELYAPNKIEKLRTITDILDNPIKLFSASLFLAIPSLMIASCVLLKPELCRWLNIIFGIIKTVVVILVGSSSLTLWYSFYVFYAFLEGIISLLIVWHAWRWPRIAESPT